MVTINEIKKFLEAEKSIKISCGEGSFREVFLKDYRNSTEAAIFAIECAKYSPCTCEGCSSEKLEQRCKWESRLFF